MLPPGAGVYGSELSVAVTQTGPVLVSEAPVAVNGSADAWDLGHTWGCGGSMLLLGDLS